DVTERAFWPRYMAAYQDVIRHTSAPYAPWHIVPADHKWFARVVIGSAIISALEDLNLRFPRVSKSAQQDFAKVRKALEDEDAEDVERPARAAKQSAGRGKSRTPADAGSARRGRRIAPDMKDRRRAR